MGQLNITVNLQENTLHDVSIMNNKFHKEMHLIF